MIKKLAALAAGAAAALYAPAQAQETTLTERSKTARVQNWHFRSISPENLKNKINQHGARIIDLEVVSTSPMRFAASLVKNKGPHASGWWWYYGINDNRVNALTKKNKARLIDVEVYRKNGQRRFAVIMVPNTGKRKTGWYWYFNQTPKSLKEKYKQHKMRLIDIERYREGGATKFAGIMVTNTGAKKTGWNWYYGQTAKQLGAKLRRHKMRPLDIERYGRGNNTRYAAIMVPYEPGGKQGTWYYHGISGPDLTKMARRHGSRVIDIETAGKRYDVILLNNGIAKAGHCGGKLKHFGNRLAGLMKRNTIPGGQIAVVKDGRLVYSCAFGQANLAKNAKVKPDSLFRIMSVSKLLTNSAIRHLENDGKLSRSDTMIDALGARAPAGPYNDDRMSDITIQNLMNHRGGFIRSNPYDPMTNQPAVAADMGENTPLTCKQIMDYAIENFPLGFDPGGAPPPDPDDDNPGYSNLGYCILQQIVRAKSGKRYSRYVKDEILAPASVTQMTIGRGRRAQRKPNEVIYYGKPFDEKRPSPYPADKKNMPRPYTIVVEAMAGHGGWIASANDLARYAAFTPTRPNGSGRTTFLGAIVGTRSMLYERSGAYVAVNLNGSPTGSGDFSDALIELAKKAVDDTTSWPTRNLWSEYGYPQN